MKLEPQSTFPFLGWPPAAALLTSLLFSPPILTSSHHHPSLLSPHPTASTPTRASACAASLRTTSRARSTRWTGSPEAPSPARGGSAAPPCLPCPLPCCISTASACVLVFFVLAIAVLLLYPPQSRVPLPCPCCRTLLLPLLFLLARPALQSRFAQLSCELNCSMLLTTRNSGKVWRQQASGSRQQWPLFQCYVPKAPFSL